MTKRQKEFLEEELTFVEGFLQRETDPEERARLQEWKEHIEKLLKARVSGKQKRPMKVKDLTNANLVTEEEKLYQAVTFPESISVENYYQTVEALHDTAKFGKKITTDPDWEIKTFHYSERPGLDHCKWAVIVSAVDSEKLKKAILDNSKAVGEKRYPFVEVARATSPDTALHLPWADKTYSKIDIILSPYCHFLMQHTNLSKKTSDGVLVEPKDTSLIETKVRPADGFEELGNFANYDVNTMKNVIYSACDTLEREFGIWILRDDIAAMYLEINQTLCLQGSFDQMRVLSYFQQYLSSAYKPALHAHPVEKAYTTDSYDLTQGLGTMSVQCLDGITSKCGSRGIEIYDKAYETQQRLLDSQDGEYSDIRFLGTESTFKESFVRLEFSVAKTNPLNDCIYYDEPNKRRKKRKTAPLLSELSQERLEGAYSHMVKKYLGDTYEQYAADADKHLETMITAANPRVKTWKTDFLKSVFLYDQASHGVPLVLRNDDADHLLNENPSFKKHPGRYRDIMHDLLSHGNRYGYRDPYRILGAIFDKAMRLNYIKENRTITYAIKSKDIS